MSSPQQVRLKGEFVNRSGSAAKCGLLEAREVGSVAASDKAEAGEHGGGHPVTTRIKYRKVTNC